MKRMLLCALVAVFCAGLKPVSAAEEEWLTDFAKAKKLAAEKKLPILIDFSGSDWCIWCMRLEEEVLSKDEFKAYAKENLILVLADFPRDVKQAEELKAQNRELAKTYGIRGYPTVILADAEGKELARTGYRPGGPEVYVEHLKELLAPKPE